jgi:toxin YoeB
MKNIVFSPDAWFDFIQWAKSDKKVFDKISELIQETSRTPFQGRGNPEPLKHKLSGYWSRRITAEHRLAYTVNAEDIQIISCKYHYQE